MCAMADKRGPKKGQKGQPGHQHNELAARIITELRSHGMPQQAISHHLEWIQAQKLLDLGDQGYSVDTLQRHYREALDQGAIPAKDLLMRRAYAMAMMDDLPKGVSPDIAYRISTEKVRWLLNVQHGVTETKAHTHSGPGGGPIPIALIEATLSAEEIHQLAYLTAKLERAAAEQ